jgi:histone H3/H4
MVGMVEDTQLAAIQAKRVTIQAKNIHLVRESEKKIVHSNQQGKLQQQTKLAL